MYTTRYSLFLPSHWLVQKRPKLKSQCKPLPEVLAANPASDEPGASELKRQRRFGAGACWAASRNEGVFLALGRNLAGE
jgi:hypothetical protein